nr:hypothetical protein [Aquicoccus sp. G2-2]MEA1113650.1 hypothetical protein [Aquicoccus sp. G2-2]
MGAVRPMIGAVYRRYPQITRLVPRISHAPAHREGRARRRLVAPAYVT